MIVCLTYCFTRRNDRVHLLSIPRLRQLFAALPFVFLSLLAPGTQAAEEGAKSEVAGEVASKKAENSAENATENAAPRFDVFEYLIEGNTVLDAAAIERAVYPFLGPQRSVQDVEQARAALEKEYQEQGYLTVSVELPEQRINTGEVKLRVVEGSVEKLRVTGAQYHLPSKIREGAPSLAAGSVPQFTEVQQELAALGRQPDRRLTPLLRPGKTPGKLEVELQVDDQLPLHASVEVNNKQSPNTVEGRVESSLRYDNLFQRGHSLGLNWIVAPNNTKHANILTANYGVPFDSGDYAYAFITQSDSDVPSGIGGGTVVKGTSLGMRYRIDLPNYGGAFGHGFSFGADYKDNKDDLTQSGLVVPRSLKYWSFAARYDQTRFDAGDGVTTAFDANLTLGIRGLAARTVDCDGVQADQFACKRFNAKPNFMVWRVGLDHRRPVWSDWKLRARTEAQFANGPLVSQEQYGTGGSDSVRGYKEYEQFGDRGALLSLELGSPLLGQWDDVSITALGFVERSQVWLLDALPGEDNSVPLGSYGLGLRADGKRFSSRLEFGVPVFATSKTQRRDGRLHMSVKLQF